MTSPSETPSSSTSAVVDAAITSRRSVRAFLSTPVPEAQVRAILQVASRAPSGSNVQPWKVYVLTGDRLTTLSDAIVAVYNDPDKAAAQSEPYAYYPRQWIEPYLARRRKVGWDLYGLLGIGKADKAAMHAQHGRNYRFFDAPVGLLFTIDATMEQGSWLDYGMFLQSIMVAARGRGLDTCPQAAFNGFHQVIRDQLNLPDNETFVCGMALGYADPDAAANRLTTERAAIDDFVTFLS
ncbi:nitroreductase [Pigmentiphaga litoralis]|uniref:nitroreductase n=1 Tax=Pigmentiphaga litoralis TaxID=516702 RepID=UPI003B429BAF